MLDPDTSAPTALVDFPPPPESPEGPRQRWRFDSPIEWLIAWHPHEVPGLLDAVHSRAKDGKWCVGWVAYEAAPGINPALETHGLPAGQPYAVWAVFDQAHSWPDSSEAPTTPLMAWQAGPWVSEQPPEAITHAVAHIQDLIRAGEVYQINLTGRLLSLWQGPPEALPDWFHALRRSQPQGYALMFDHRANADYSGAVLSVSPELFFDWDGHTLTTRPMKGTAPRGADSATDQAARDHLLSSAKERAENLMIVDLLRNDLSQVAEVGSVRVPSLFDVQALPTVWQMTSTITARSRANLRLSEVFAALFPCGSITGAPKRQAMHHIVRLESNPRGVYCGAVGLMHPGGRVTLNVPIRTVCVHTPPSNPWSLTCGIGSGITLDSTGPGEANEWLAKQAFLKRAETPFQILESLRLENGQIPRLTAHLKRAIQSALHFNHVSTEQTPHLEQTLRSELQRTAQAHPHGAHKVRVLINAQAQVHVEAAPLPDTAQPIRVAMAPHAMPPADEFIRHKTTRREAYAPFKAPTGCFDTLLYNQDDELTEFTIGNLAVQLDQQWYTPPLSCGLLPGVMRATLLAEGKLTERRLTRGDLMQAQGLALINSVRGWLEVDLPALRASWIHPDQRS